MDEKRKSTNGKEKSENVANARKKKPGTSQQVPRCMKCLEQGHWSYQCKAKRKHLVRASRSQLLDKSTKILQNGKKKRCQNSKKKKKLLKASGKCAGCSSQPRRVPKKKRNEGSASESSSSTSSLTTCSATSGSVCTNCSDSSCSGSASSSD